MSFISSFEKMELSERDKTILNCVFNPHLPLEEAIEENSQELQGTSINNYINPF